MTEENKRNNEVYVWDADLPHDFGDDATILWRQSVENNRVNTFSISQLVEKDADALREQYLAWIYKLGQARIRGKKVVEHLSLRSGLSYWWMGALAQKFNLSERSGIHDAFKVMALEKWLAEQNFHALVLFSENDQLDECLRSMCLKKGMRYERRHLLWQEREKRKSSLFQRLPYFCQAVIYFSGYLFRAAPLLFSKKRFETSDFGQIMFIDILVHLDAKALAQGKFRSNYWTDLVEKLNEWKIKCAWLHLFYRYPAVPNHACAQNKIHLFNQEGTQFHCLLESTISFKTFWRCALDCVRLRNKALSISAISDIGLDNSDLNLWPLHVTAWNLSVFGGEAVINCLRISLFETLLRKVPNQKLGIYLAENQPWEMALLYAWKTNGHQAIVGVPHTTVRFWDLRYHHDFRCYTEKDELIRMPQSDGLAVNGPAAHQSLVSGGYPSERLLSVEALRFRHLVDVVRKKNDPQPDSSSLRVLICGDFLAETNKKMLAWVGSAAALLSAETTYTLKPHPAFPIDDTDFPKIQIHVTDSSMPELLRHVDVVFASDTTSAAVDAYCSGVPVVIMWDGGNFNLSPLRGVPDVNYVRSIDELVMALGNVKRDSIISPHEFFYQNSELPGWRKLIESHASVHL